MSTMTWERCEVGYKLLAVNLRYSTEFGTFRDQLHKSV